MEAGHAGEISSAPEVARLPPEQNQVLLADYNIETYIDIDMINEACLKTVVSDLDIKLTLLHITFQTNRIEFKLNLITMCWNYVEPYTVYSAIIK